MGRAVEFNLGNHSSDETCPGCGMKTKDKKGCCNDKETTIKISDKYQHSLSDFKISTPIFSVQTLLLTPYLISNNFNSKPEFHQSNFSPQKTLSRHIFNCTFLI